jgi:hypothetical protein
VHDVERSVHRGFRACLQRRHCDRCELGLESAGDERTRSRVK